MFTIILIVFYVQYTESTNITNIIEKNDKIIKSLCVNRTNFCESNYTKLCAVRKIGDDYEYKTFNNSCYLFISNICENPENEFTIIQGGVCNEEITNRRMYMQSGIELPTRPEPMSPVQINGSTPKIALRKKTTTFLRLYEDLESWDGHTCVLRCPDTRSPVCLTANRGNGLYFKFWTFENHCLADLYYCKHTDEFRLPPNADSDDEEEVRISPLSWSDCASHKFLQFARFSETASAMAHYGWMAGEYRSTHIMEPYERFVGYGK